MSDRLCSKCKECVKKSNKQYRNTHKEYWRDYNKRYYKRTKEELASKLGKKCYICGRTPKENRKLFLAHEIYGRPHSQSRNYVMKHIEDFVCLCVPCHRCVHFCMKYLGLTWNQIVEFIKLADMKPTDKADRQTSLSDFEPFKEITESLARDQEKVRELYGKKQRENERRNV